MEYQMEDRKCRVCGKQFRSLATSNQKMCSQLCMSLSGEVPPRRTFKSREELAAGSKRGSGIDVDTKTQSFEKGRPSAAVSLIKEIPASKVRAESVTTGNTKQSETPKRPSGKEKTESTSKTIGENTMQRTESASSPKLLPTVIGDNLPGQSDDSSGHLETVALDSMNLLKQSSNRLLNLMKESVSDLDLQRATDGDKRVEAHRIDTAIQSANALAQTVQVQVNMLKAITGFRNKAN